MSCSALGRRRPPPPATLTPSAVLRVGREELGGQPPEHVVDDRLGDRDLAGCSVKPDGSKRMWLNLSTRTCSGTPYCSAQRDRRARRRPSRPEIVEPSLAIVEEDLARHAVLVEADGDVALVAADVELVGDRLALVGQLAADAAGGTAAARPRRRASAFASRPSTVFSGCVALAAVAVDGDRLEAELPAPRCRPARCPRRWRPSAC
ncbi:MAG: hypothetical protein MZV64_13900 [Ignavibacteriales bacterium]|nr:hypothetical protein [Ignavibacteriales bacterium]